MKRSLTLAAPHALWGALLASSVMTASIVAACSATNNPPPGTGGAGGHGAGPGAGGGDDGGLFTDGSSSGDAGPDAPLGPCDASCEAAGGQCVSGTCVLSDNPGGIDAPTQTTLEAGGSSDPAFAILYPYDRTIFGRGLLPPTLQFGGAPPDGVLVRITSPGLDYTGFYGPSNPGRLTIAQGIWTAITLAGTGLADVTVKITKISGGNVTGPITQTWGIAKGSLRGAIYYETYNSAILGGFGSVGIMKIQPGASTPTPVKSGCGNVCHTASADGSTLVAATSLLSSASWDLKNNASLIFAQPNATFTYGGIYKDGSVVMSATNYRTWLLNPSRLYDTKTGANIPAPGWDNLVTNAACPAFSPDGKKIVFNHEDTGGGHSLAVADFDFATKTFSNITDIVSDPSRFLGWPAFTPDGKRVVFHAGTSEVFETNSGAKGDLYEVDVASHQAVKLEALDGYLNGQTYLPASDPDLSFVPTVLPVAVGGYYWVVFTSHRSYGNTLPSLDNNGENGKLWVAALDISPMPGKDPSHPAFFLDGQELTSNNLRGFWVLDPCKPDGSDCHSGAECCNGYCRPADDAGYVCTPDNGGCSNTLEKCITAADCCDASAQCINGYCAEPPPK